MSAVLSSLALVSLGLAAWQFLVAWRFPVHRRGAVPRLCPGITLLKPVKGCDGQTEACLRSWFQQDYAGPVQLLIGVASMDDPAVPVIRRLIEAHPGRNAELIHCSRELGTNAKVSNLIQLHEQSLHPFLCVSDADVLAPRDFLAQSMSLLEDEQVGLANSFYEVRTAVGIGPRWEALAINADFWSQVLQSASLKPVDFALGAAMVFRREPFESFGGFRPLADHLADDYHLGRHFAERGLKIQLSPVVVECQADRSSFGAVWERQLRWARTIRSCQPWPYFFSIISNSTLWPLAWWAAAPSAATALSAGAMLVVRSLQASLLEHRLTGRWNASALWMAWIKDLLQVGVWAMAFAGTTVFWRGIRYSIDRHGKIRRLGFSPRL